MSIGSPSHSPEAEASALGSVLIRPDLAVQVTGALETDDFLMPLHREIFDSVRTLARRQTPIDGVAIFDDMRSRGADRLLPSGLTGLIDIWNSTPSAEHAMSYVQTVREHSTIRKLVAACADVVAAGGIGIADREAFVTESVAKVAAIAMRGSNAKSETLDDVFGKILDRLEREEKGEVVSRIPTGIAKLDELMDGGMANEHLVVPCALTSIGKSSWGLQVIVRGAAERGVRGLIFTIDMTKAEMFIKGACSLARMDTRTFVKPASVVQWKQIRDAGQRMAALKDLVTIEEHRNLGQIVAAAHAWRSRNPGPAIMMVDHIQKVSGTRAKNANREEEVAGIAATLKNTARDLKLPVVAPSQLNEDSVKENRAPRLGDLRESKAIGHEADVVLGIHRNRMETNGNAELLVLKHRGGRIGKRTVRWAGAHQGFEDPAPGSRDAGDEDD